MDYKDDDIDPEDIASAPEDEEVGEEKAEAKIAKMRDELHACQKEKQECMDGWQRARADYVNALKRFEEERVSTRERGIEQAVRALLPALDALERAKGHGELPDGFAAIARQLEAGFAALNLEALGEVGEKFDPAFHEALGRDAADALETDNTITVVLEKGWKLGDRIIRPAKVRVAHFE